MLIKSSFYFLTFGGNSFFYMISHITVAYRWSTAYLIDLFTKYVLYPCMFIIYVLYLCKHSLHKIQQYYCLIDEQRVCMGPYMYLNEKGRCNFLSWEHYVFGTWVK